MIRPTILHSSNTGIMAAAVVVVAADAMDVDKAECSINRILPVRHPRFRASSDYKISALQAERGGYSYVFADFRLPTSDF
jgi:hypothetical protein